MAYDPNQQTSNEQNPAQPNLMMTSAAPGAGPAPTRGGTAPQANPAQPFQNLQAYLTANQPQVNAQSERMANDLNTQYGQVRNDVNQGQNAFNTEVQGGYAQPNPDLTNQAASNPAAFVSNPQNVQAFQALYNDTYNGPSNFESSAPYGSLSSEISNATSNANLVNTTPGLETFFQGQNPNATQGGNTLDTVLLQGTPEAYGRVRGAANQFTGLPDYLANATTQADQGVINAQTAAQNEAQGLRSQFTGDQGVIPTFESDLGNRVSQARANSQSQEDQLRQYLTDIGGMVPGAIGSNPPARDIPGINAINNPNLYSDVNNDPNMSRYLGAYRALISGLIGGPRNLGGEGEQPISPLQYLTQQSPDVSINQANLATPEDYSRSAALSTLTGQDLSSFLNPANAAQAGTANMNLNQFNARSAYNDVANRLNEILALNPNSPVHRYDLIP